MKQGTIKVFSGIYKGKHLHEPNKDVTRVSKSILKESFFNTMFMDIKDATFVEGFAGSGSIGIEALSNGAKRAFFIEKDREAYSVLKRNLKEIAVNSQYETFNDNFFKRIDELHNILKKDDMNILYLDPPFDIREGNSEIYEMLKDKIKNLNKFSVIAFEIATAYKLDDKIHNFTRFKYKKFGKSSLVYFMRDDLIEED